MGGTTGKNHQEILQNIQNRMRDHARSMAGVDDTDGFLIAAMIRIVGNLYENLKAEGEEADELSGPRLGVLIRLVEEERGGNHEGITPTVLSRNQHVSRNTISALLRGLEEQGLIERQLDPKDRRLFRIRVTEAGRQRVQDLAPRRIFLANHLISSLTTQDREQLIALLGKLFISLHTHSHCCEKHFPDESLHEEFHRGDAESAEEKI